MRTALARALLLVLGIAVGAAQAEIIEEIVVTAQKREQNINDVPITITAYSGQTVEDLGIRSAEDMEYLTPGLEVNTTGVREPRSGQSAV